VDAPYAAVIIGVAFGATVRNYTNDDVFYQDKLGTNIGKSWENTHTRALLQVIAIDNSAEARAKAEELGATASIDASLGDDYVREEMARWGRF
jgi:Zn-dependent alcohol dehydrogenase